jgi:hypothetical protein
MTMFAVIRHVRVAVVGFALLLGGWYLLAPGTPGQLSTPAAAAQGKEAVRHPHIRAAMRELKDARKELAEAAHDFGGHRKEALKAVDHAIVQLEKALKFAR